MTRATSKARPGLEELDTYRLMRDTDPVAYNPRTGCWSVYRYQDVASILADFRTFSSDFRAVYPESAPLGEGNIVAMDPPRHDQLRRLVSQAFTPRAIARLEGRIAALTDELLDQTDGRAEIELVGDLAYPLPVTVIAELLGVPAADRPRFKVWADALLDQENLNRNEKAAIERAKAQIRNFHEYLREHVEQRRIQPRDDLLSDLVEARLDGESLGDQEIVGFATLLLLAGHITTTLLLGNAILSLDENPGTQEALRANPAAIPTAIEEVLRYRSPVVLTRRVTTTEVQIAGKVIPPREMLNVMLLSANHDERQFEHPDDFVIDRQPNPHFAFGKGIHFCLGAPLARLESRIALDRMLRRFSRISRDPCQPPAFYALPGFNGLRALHLLVERS